MLCSPLGGTGIADAIFGDYVPAGRMPISIFPLNVTLPNIVDYNMTDGVGRTYRFVLGPKMFSAVFSYRSSVIFLDELAVSYVCV